MPRRSPLGVTLICLWAAGALAAAGSPVTRPASRPAGAPASAPARKPPVEPDMVGLWLGELQIGNGRIPLLAQIYPDGRFTWRIPHQPGAPFNHGTLRAADGVYRETLKDGFVNEGTYKLIDANNFEMTNKNGARSVWKLKNADPDRL